MKRTTVFADEDDLAVIKAAAAQRGIAEAEIIREAIHLAALANQSWDDPFFSKTFRAEPRKSARKVSDTVWADRAVAYEKTRRKRRPSGAAAPQ